VKFNLGGGTIVASEKPVSPVKEERGDNEEEEEIDYNNTTSSDDEYEENEEQVQRLAKFLGTES
jgi:hypothetical protein